jgi:hypothetical protein
MARLTVAFSYVLSRVAFVATHVVFAYWLNFILNDPLDLGLVTLDAKPPLLYARLVVFFLIFLYFFSFSRPMTLVADVSCPMA